MALAGSSTKYLKNLVEKFGPVFTLHMGSQPVVVLNNYDTVKKILNDGNVISDRCPIPALDDYYQGRGLIATQYSTGDWKTVRTFAHKALKHFGVGRNSFESVISWQVERCLDFIQKKHHQQPFDPQDCIYATICGVTCGVVLGKQFEYEDVRYKHLLRTLHNAMRSIEYAALCCLVPGMGFLAKKKYKQFYDVMDMGIEFIREEIEEHESSLDPDNPRDVVDVYLCEKRRLSPEDPTSRLFTNNNIEFSMWDLFIAGTETSSGVIYWLVLLIASNPDVQTKIQQEIDDVTKGSDHVSIADGHKIPYTKAAIEEGLRYACAATSVMRSTTSDVTVDGHRLDVGTWLMLNYEHTSFDPERWEEPYSFNPERFIDQDGNFCNNKPLITFGSGNRNCLGEKLARMEIFLFITNILKRFHLEFPESDHKPSTTEVKGGITRVPKSYEVCFKPRKPSTGYDCLLNNED